MLRVNRKSKSKLMWDKVQDSGTRSAFGTGSQRDTQDGKGRYDLIPSVMLARLAQHYENGALKYGDNNWQKGQPLAQYYNSAMRHLTAIKDADISEDHFAAAIWNVAAMIHHIDAMMDMKLPVTLDSFGILDAIKNHERDATIKEYAYDDTTPFHQPTVTLDFSRALRTLVLASGMPPHNMPFTESVDTISDTVVAFDKDRFSKRPPKR